MTEKLFTADTYLFEFDAHVLRVVPPSGPQSDLSEVILDRTAFYPTAGGQPHDTGTIGDARVLDCVEDDETGVVRHFVSGVVVEGPVHCVVDEPRRRDHAQQHSGQHVLSQAFVELFGWPTVSFHLGVDFCTIDLAVESVSSEQLESAERRANDIVRADRPVHVRYISSEQLQEVGLRKPTDRVGLVRVVEVADFDRSACCGTHVRRTGEIGPIFLTGVERAKRQTRVQFICGERSIRYGRESIRTLQRIGQQLSVPPLATSSATENLLKELQANRKQVQELSERLIDFEAAAFPSTAGLAAGVFDDRGLEAIKLLAQKVSRKSGLVCAFLDRGAVTRVVLARSADRLENMAELLKSLTREFGGKGGGRPDFAQGSLESADPEAVLELVRRSLAEGESR